MKTLSINLSVLLKYTLGVLLWYSSTGIAYAQTLVPTGRLTLTLPGSAGVMYDLSQFPDFTAPNGKKVIFSATGRLQAPNTNNLTSGMGTSVIFNRGYTHLVGSCMTLNEYGSPGAWTNIIPKSRRVAFNPTGIWSNLETGPPFKMRWTDKNKQTDGKDDPFYDYYENNPNSTAQVLKYAVRGVPGYLDAPQGNEQYGTGRVTTT